MAQPQYYSTPPPLQTTASHSRVPYLKHVPRPLKPLVMSGGATGR